jgi:hypothetical protein
LGRWPQQGTQRPGAPYENFQDYLQPKALEVTRTRRNHACREVRCQEKILILQFLQTFLLKILPRSPRKVAGLGESSGLEARDPPPPPSPKRRPNLNEANQPTKSALTCYTTTPSFRQWPEKGHQLRRQRKVVSAQSGVPTASSAVGKRADRSRSQNPHEGARSRRQQGIARSCSKLNSVAWNIRLCMAVI